MASAEQREAAMASLFQLMDSGTPTAVLLVHLQRQHGYSRAQSYRLIREAREQRGGEGIAAKPSGSELIAMAQSMLGQALAEASLIGDGPTVAKLSKVLLETLKANGSITQTMGPEPDAAIDCLMAVKAAHTREQ